MSWKGCPSVSARGLGRTFCCPDGVAVVVDNAGAPQTVLSGWPSECLAFLRGEDGPVGSTARSGGGSDVAIVASIGSFLLFVVAVVLLALYMRHRRWV